VIVENIQSQRRLMAQSANLLKRTDRLLWREAEICAKNPDMFILVKNIYTNFNGVWPLMPQAV